MTGLEWVLHQEEGQFEGQFFERKSCYDRSQGKVKRRPARDVARDVAETLAAMTNADGGAVALGLEDDRTVTGADYPDDRMDVLCLAPQTYVRPPLRARLQAGMLNGKQILIYEVDWSADVSQSTDGRYLPRVGDQCMPFPATDSDAEEWVGAGALFRSWSYFLPELLPVWECQRLNRWLRTAAFHMELLTTVNQLLSSLILATPI